MWQFVLSRRWWAGHLLVALCCALFIRLGRWQWDRAESAAGDWQNLGYALQWPLFAVVLVAGWARFLWLEQRRVPETVPAPDPPTLIPPAARRSAHIRPEDDPHDELAAYNAYLARLAERDRQA